MSQLQVHLLGTPRIIWQDQPIKLRRRKSMALVAYLAVTQQPETREKLADLLWVDSENNRAYLRQMLFRLRKDFPEELVISEDHVLRLNPELKLWIDVGKFDQFSQLEDQEYTDLAMLQKLADLYTDEFMKGFSLDDAPAFDKWVQKEREYFHEQYLKVLEALARGYQSQHNLTQAIQYAKQVLELNPLNEPMHRMLIRLYIQSKQHNAAIQQYHYLVKLLRNELGLDPHPASRKLYDDVLNMQVMPDDTDPLMYKQASFGLYPPMPARLIARNDLLTQVQNNLSAVNNTTTVLCGLPGVGKTALAATLAHQAVTNTWFPDGILWVTLGKEPDVISHLRVWCRTHYVTEDQDINATVMRLRGALAKQQILIVIDDVWNVDDAVPFMVGGRKSATLVTTRFPSVAREITMPFHTTIDVPVLTVEESIELLRQLAPEVMEEYPEEVQELVCLYDGVPLILIMLGQLLRDEWRFGQVEDLIQDLNESSSKLFDSPTFADGLTSFGDRGITLGERMLSILRLLSHFYIQKQCLEALETKTYSSAQLSELWQVENSIQYTREFLDLGMLSEDGKDAFRIYPIWRQYLRG